MRGAKLDSFTDVSFDIAVNDLETLYGILMAFTTSQDLIIRSSSSYVVGMVEGFLYPVSDHPLLKDCLRAVHRALKPHTYECVWVCGKCAASVAVAVREGGETRSKEKELERLGALVVSLTPMAQ